MEWLQGDSLHEECGVIGIYRTEKNASRLAYYGLYALQHRGQESAGIAVSELYTSLAQKIVDGCEFPFADAYTRQLYEVVKYGANQAYVTTHDFWGMSSSLWNSLTAEQQKVINEAAAEASAYSFEIFRGLEAEGKQKLIDNGMKFVDVDIESFRACVDTFYSLMNWDADFVAQIEGAMAAYRAKN